MSILNARTDYEMRVFWAEGLLDWMDRSFFARFSRVTESLDI